MAFVRPLNDILDSGASPRCSAVEGAALVCIHAVRHMPAVVVDVFCNLKRWKDPIGPILKPWPMSMGEAGRPSTPAGRVGKHV